MPYSQAVCIALLLYAWLQYFLVIPNLKPPMRKNPSVCVCVGGNLIIKSQEQHPSF